MPLRILLAFGIPMGLLVAGSIVHDSGFSTALIGAAIVSLLVWVAESLFDSKRQPHGSNADEAVPVETKKATDLFTLVGDTTRMLVELSRVEAPVLDGWLSLISGRVARVTGSAAASFMVLRETLILVGEDFVPGCEVMHRGGSTQYSLTVGQRVQTRDALEEDLLLEIGAGSLYLAEFNLNQDRYLLCLALSSDQPHQPALQTLCKIMVAQVSVSLGPEVSRATQRIDLPSLDNPTKGH